ncbi:MAG TPA: hypothetical protein PLC67_08560 [Spirochaetota bacterium]|mgnify:CR=1 FL=1|nr:hypothetical protein [Spirochaetota bacterium]
MKKTVIILILFCVPISFSNMVFSVDFITGKPSDIDLKKDYFRAGMDAGYKKDFYSAAIGMRYSYYSKPDSYRFFWYLKQLSDAKLYDAVIKEFNAAPEDYYYHKAYLFGAVRYYAQALLEKGKRDDAVKVLFKYYAKQRDKDIAVMLMTHFWNSEKCGNVFILNSKHDEMLKDIADKFLLNYDEKNSSLAAAFFDHMCVAVSQAAITGINDRKMNESFIFRFDLMKKVFEVWKNDSKSINRMDFESLIRAFDYFAKNPPLVKKPYEFTWLNIYVPRVNSSIIINGKNKAVKIEFPKDEISRRIFDTTMHFNTLAVFYYYLSSGNILMKSRFEIIDAEVTRSDTASSIQSIVTESIRPYPSKLLYDNFRQYDGVMWFFPHYETATYLGGVKSLVLVPDFLSAKDFRMFTKMPTSASWRVLIHEVFHNFGHFCGVDNGHTFAEANKAKWPAWYAELVKDNAGKNGELFWYEGLISRRDNSDNFAEVKKAKESYLPQQDVFKKALVYSSKTSDDACTYAREILSNADKVQNDLKKQTELIKSAIDKAPLMPLPLFKYVYAVQWREKNYEKSIPYYEKYLELFSGFDDSDSALIYLVGWYTSKNPERALFLLDKYGQNPSNEKVRNELNERRIKLLKINKKNEK